MRVSFPPQFCSPKLGVRHFVNNKRELNSKNGGYQNISFRGDICVPKFLRKMFGRVAVAGNLLFTGCFTQFPESVSKGHISKVFERNIDLVENTVSSEIICDSIKLKKNNKVYYQQGKKFLKQPIIFGMAKYDATFVAKDLVSQNKTNQSAFIQDRVIVKNSSPYLLQQFRFGCDDRTYDIIKFSITEMFQENDFMFYSSEMTINRLFNDKNENLKFNDLEFYTSPKK